MTVLSKIAVCLAVTRIKGNIGTGKIGCEQWTQFPDDIFELYVFCDDLSLKIQASHTTLIFVPTATRLKTTWPINNGPGRRERETLGSERLSRCTCFQWGTLRSIDVDGNENVIKTIGLMSKTTTLHVHHAFLYISFLFLHDFDVKMPNLAF